MMGLFWEFWRVSFTSFNGTGECFQGVLMSLQECLQTTGYHTQLPEIEMIVIKSGEKDKAVIR